MNRTLIRARRGSKRKRVRALIGVVTARLQDAQRPRRRSENLQAHLDRQMRILQARERRLHEEEKVANSPPKPKSKQVYHVAHGSLSENSEGAYKVGGFHEKWGRM